MLSILPPLHKFIRRNIPDRLRDHVIVRAVAVSSGLISPRALHSTAEADLIGRLAVNAKTAVEIGVYEGASASILARSLPSGGSLYLIDPFGHHPTALRGPGMVRSRGPHG